MLLLLVTFLSALLVEIALILASHDLMAQTTTTTLHGLSSNQIHFVQQEPINEHTRRMLPVVRQLQYGRSTGANPKNSLGWLQEFNNKPSF